MTAATGTVTLPELRRLVGTAWIALAGRVNGSGECSLRSVAAADERLDIVSVQPSLELAHPHVDPFWDVVTRECGAAHQTHDLTFFAIETRSGDKFIIDAVTPFYLHLLLTTDPGEHPSGFAFRGIATNRLDPEVITTAIHELNRSGLLVPFLNDKEPST